MNNFEYDFVMRKQSFDQGIEINKDIASDIELKYKIYDHHFTYNIKSFISFLKNKNNMIYFLARAKTLPMIPLETCLTIDRDIVAPLVEGDENINKNLSKIDQDTFTEILSGYFANTAFDEEKHIPNIIQALFPLETKLNTLNEFNEEEMIKNFYSDVTKNSFSEGIELFDSYKEDLSSKFKEKSMQNDFITFSEQATEKILHIKEYVVEGDTAYLSEKNYKSKRKTQWIPLLNKSRIQFDVADPYAAFFSKAVLQYIIAYSIMQTIKQNNKSNKILAKNFQYVSEFSPFLHYVLELLKLDKPYVKYIFVKLVIECCNASNSETKLLTEFLDVQNKSTFKNNENVLPIIEKMDCPILDIF